MNTFNELKIKPELLQALSDMNFVEPTPIQRECIPHILTGADCLAQAPTGTGKTCAFGIPAVEMTDVSIKKVQTIIMCPTRELAMQTEKEIKKLSRHIKGLKVLAIFGGQNIERQFAGLRSGAQIVVGTPGRVIDHLKRKTLKLDEVKFVVLDEADEMLNMGFREDIDYILSKLDKKAQTVLFSATMAKEILNISTNYQTNPIMVKTTLNQSEMPVIKQFIIKLKESTKFEAFKKIMSENNYTFVLCFCNTKRRVDQLTEEMEKNNFLAGALHGDLRQRQRDIMMQKFRTRKINILIATDVAARGIDVDDVEAVFNFDMPPDNEYYIHRIGRTARANKTGESYSFTTTRDFPRLREIERFTQVNMEELIIDGITDSQIDTRLSKQKKFTVPMSRMFLNVGKLDGLKEESLKDLIIEKTGLISDNLVSIKVLDSYSFIEVEKHVADNFLTIDGTEYKNRRISAERANGGDSGSKSRSRVSRPSVASSYNKSERPSRESSFKKSFGKKENRIGGERPELVKRETEFFSQMESETATKADFKQKVSKFDGEKKRDYKKTGDFKKKDFGVDKKKEFGKSDFKKKEFGSADGYKKKEFGSADGYKKKEFGSSDFKKKEFGSSDFKKREFGEKKESGSSDGYKKKEFGSSDFKKKELGSSDFKKKEFGSADGYKKKEFGSSDFKKKEFGEKKSYSKSSRPTQGSFAGAKRKINREAE